MCICDKQLWKGSKEEINKYIICFFCSFRKVKMGSYQCWWSWWSNTETTCRTFCCQCKTYRHLFFNLQNCSFQMQFQYIVNICRFTRGCMFGVVGTDTERLGIIKLKMLVFYINILFKVFFLYNIFSLVFFYLQWVLNVLFRFAAKICGFWRQVRNTPFLKKHTQNF